MKDSYENRTGSEKPMKRNRSTSQVIRMAALGIMIFGGVFLLLILVGGNSSGTMQLSAKYVGNTEVQLQWSGGFGAGDFDRYEIYRDDGLLETINDNEQNMYADTTLEVYNSYDYRVEVYKWNESHTEVKLRDAGYLENITTGDVHGTVIIDTALTLGDGPYALTGNVIVDEEADLTIGSGTVIQGGGYAVEGAIPNINEITYFDGGLIFRNLNSIMITNSTFDSTGIASGWPGVKIMNSSSITITGNSFQGFDPGAWPHENPGIRFDEQQSSPRCSIVEIKNNEFEDCAYGIFAWNLDDAEIENNEFIDTDFSIFIDDEFRDSSFSSNEIKRIDDPYDRVQGGEVVAVNSSIYGNTFTSIDQYFTMKGENSDFSMNTMTNCNSGILVDGRNQKVFWNTVTGTTISENGRGMGINFGGDGIEIYENEISGFSRAGIYTLDDVSNSLLTKNNITGCEVGIYSSIFEILDNFTIQENRVLDSKEDGIQIQAAENVTIRNNEILDNEGNGIWLKDDCVNNKVMGNTITGTGHNGIYIGFDKGMRGNGRNLIEGNTISDSDRDIRIEGHWDVSYGFVLGDNNTIHNNVLSGSPWGIYIEGASNNTFTNNSITEMVMRGIEIDYYYSTSWKRYAHSMNNRIENNRIATQKGIGREVYEKIIEPTNTQWVKNIHGNTYPTTLSMSGFNSTYFGRGVDDPPELPHPPEHPSKNVNISNFFEIWYKGRPYEMTFFYTNDQLGELKEENLWVWRYNWTGDKDNGTWIEDKEKNVWLNVWGNYIERNELEVKITNSSGWSLYAPLIPMPVHNINTEEDFNTIQDAINDEDTVNGHTITVDPSYTIGETKENIDIHKKIILRSSSGGPAINTIRAEDEHEDVIILSVNEVTIEGFTIRGSSSKRGVYRQGNLDDITIKNCLFTENFIGIVFTGIEGEGRGRSRAAYHEILECTFTGNFNSGILLNVTENSHVTDSTFSGNTYGLAIQDAIGAYVVGCTFEEDLEIGLYVVRGSEHSLTGNSFTKCPTGMRIEHSTMNDAIYTECTENDIGIHLLNADENTVTESTFEKLLEIGIKLEGSDENILQNVTMTGSGGGANIGIDILNSNLNEIHGAEIKNVNTVGFGATGVRIHGGSNYNTIADSTIQNIESSNSTGILLDASLNEIRDTTIQELKSYGDLGSVGIIFYPNANGNSLARVIIFDIEGNATTVGVDVNSAKDNIFNACQVTDINSLLEKSYGFRFNGCESGSVKSGDIKNCDIGILCESGSTPEIHWNTISGNTEFGVKNSDETVTVNAENNNWGHTSGPGGVGPGTGDNVSPGVDYEPWLGEETTTPHQETTTVGLGLVDVKAESDLEVEYNAKSAVVITTLTYLSNPGTGFSGSIGKYIDVNIDDPDGMTSMIVKLYYTEDELGDKDESTLRLHWWDGTTWAQCSSTGVETEDIDGYSGYIWALIGSDSSPSLDDLGGTPFAAGEGDPAIGPDNDEIGEDEGLDEWVIILGGIIILFIGIFGIYYLAFSGKKCSTPAKDHSKGEEMNKKEMAEKLGGESSNDGVGSSDEGNEGEVNTGGGEEGEDPETREKQIEKAVGDSSDPLKMTKADIIPLMNEE